MNAASMLLLAALATGCVADDGSVAAEGSAAADGSAAAEGSDQTPIAVEPLDNNTAVVNYCTWSQGSYWCQDYYTTDWCTNGVWETAWDYTGCTWRGWNSSGTAFCGTNYPGYTAGYEWGEPHLHCN